MSRVNSEKMLTTIHSSATQSCVCSVPFRKTLSFLSITHYNWSNYQLRIVIWSSIVCVLFGNL